MPGQVAAAVTALAAKYSGRVGEQRLAITPKYLRQESRGKSKPVDFARQRRGLQRAQAQQRQWIVSRGAQVVRPVEGARMLDQTALFAAGGRPFVRDLIVEEVDQTAGVIRIGSHEIVGLVAPGCARRTVTGE